MPKCGKFGAAATAGWARITPSTICIPTMFSFLWLLSALATFIRLSLILLMFFLLALLLIARLPALASV
jgi:hypothetical protein